MRIFSKEEMKIINYILGKDENDKYITEDELDFVKDFDFTDKCLPSIAKKVWDNRNNPKLLKLFIKIAKQEDENEIAKTIDKLVKRKEDKHMNDIMIFKNDNFGEIRSLEINNKPWFVGKDICKIFGDTNHKRSLSKIDEDEKTIVPVQTNGGIQNMTVLNESGLYSLLFNMQPEKAKGVSQNDPRIDERIKKLKQFKRWVTHEVLPSIRKNGSYSLDTNGLMKQLAQSQITLNNVLAGFKMQIDNDFKIANEKLTEHDELLKKRVYLSPKEAKDIQVAIKNKAQQIAIEYNLPYHTVKGKLFKRLYTALNDYYEVATYRELPSIKYEDIIDTIKGLSIYIRDIQEEEYQLSF